jgi:acyl-CoA thioester hydrolase
MMKRLGALAMAFLQWLNHFQTAVSHECRRRAVSARTPSDGTADIGFADQSPLQHDRPPKRREVTAAPVAPDTVAVRVYYEDTDASGRVYHASYVRFLERGRTEWLRTRGFSHRELAASDGIAFVVRAMTIDFLAPAQIDDLLVVETGAEPPRGASIVFRQRILLGDRAIVEASVRAAGIRGGRPVRLSAAMRQALG